MTNPESRYVEVSRRAMLKRTLGASGLMLFPGLACGNGDADTLGGASVQTTAGNAAATTEAPALQDPVTSEASETTTTIAPASADGQALPSGSELVVDFTYEQGAGGKNLPPYVAVWIEDGEGELVDTIALWFEQSGKGTRWLPDLRRWFNVDQARIDGGGSEQVDVISSATRLPGSFSVVWDGAVDGVAVGSGEYFICIESARERGPYSLIREPITLDGTSVEQSLASDGELVAASVALTA